MAEKLRRKDLKGPDEFISATQRTVEYAQENQLAVILVVGGVVLLLALALGVSSYRDSQISAASTALGRAYRDLTGEYPGSGASRLVEVAKHWSGTSTAVVARAYAANEFLANRETEKAREQYSALLEESSEPFYRQMALYNLGILALRAGASKEARQLLSEAAAIDGPFSGAAALVADVDQPPESIPEGIGQDAQEYLASVKPS